MLFINLSNHPFSTWDERQLQAAAVYGKLVDIPFPAVDPAGDEAYIQELADEYEYQILKMAEERAVTVHLMGEMNFCFALIKRLAEHGIRCVASTSKRIVSETNDGEKNSIFHFQRFREYEF